MEEIKAHFAGFLNVTALATDHDGNEITIRVRLNPNTIYSYAESQASFKDGSRKDVTVVYCGERFTVDLPIEEFDKFIQNVDRGISFEEKK